MEIRAIDKNTGCIYVVATPIGNLEDITYRAVRMLSEVDLILCEDTRHTIILLNHFKISKPLKSYHSYNEKRVVDDIIIQIKNGKNIALVSDSGTPCISDPGYVLISHAVSNNIAVLPIPGPSAFLALLSASGFPTKTFQFIGFLPIKKNKRRKILNDLQNFDGIIILYESPYRIIKLLENLSEFFPNNQIVIGRELTKKFEEIVRGTTNEILSNINNLKIKGEYTILINNFI